MLAAVLVMLLAADADGPERTAPTTRPAAIVLPIADKGADCAATPTDIGCAEHAQSRYRLPLPEEAQPTSKDRAIAETGEQCALVGAKMCTSHGRTVLSAPLSNSTQP